MKAKTVVENRKFSPRAELCRACGAANGERYIYRNRFFVETLAAKAELLMLGAGYFRVYIGGVFCCEYDLRSYVYCRDYVCVDISEFVKIGENTVTVETIETGEDKYSGFCVELAPWNFSDKWECTKNPISVSPVSYFVGGGEEICDFGREESEPEWHAAETVPLSQVFPVLNQSKQKLTERKKVTPSSLLCAEKAERLSEYEFSFISDGGVFAVFRASLDVNSDTEISLVSTKNATRFFVDGDEIKSSNMASLACGKHTIAVCNAYGGETSFFACCDGKIAFSGWEKLQLKLPKAPFRYPWNEPRRASELPQEAEKFIKSPDLAGERVYPENRFSVYHDVRNRKTSEADLHPNENGAIKVPKGFGKASFTFDFGREIVGSISFEVESEAECDASFFMFEMITPGGIRYMNGCNFGKIICKKGKNRFESACIRGFRYLSVCVDSSLGEVTLSGVCAIEARYPADETCGFSSSDKMLDGIYKISADTARVCMLDSYVDCPGCEQNIWTGDAGITAMINMTNFGGGDFDGRYLHSIGESMNPEMKNTYRRGNPRYLTPDFMPCACFPTYPEGTIPIWSFTFANQLIDHYLYFGKDEYFTANIAFLEECLVRAERHIDSRGLFEIDGAWNLIEWADNDLLPCGEVSANNMMLAGLFARSAELFREIGKGNLSAHCSDMAKSLRNAINTYLWSDEKAGYLDSARDDFAYENYVSFCAKKGRTALDRRDFALLARTSVQSATFALLYGVATGEREKISFETVLSAVRSGEYRRGTPANVFPEEKPSAVGIGTPFFLYYVLKLLYEKGEYALALDVIRRDWGSMIEDGLRSCVETFKDSAGEWGRSAAHAWSASPAIFCKTEILGIKPLKAGYTEFSVEPHLCGLEYARGSVPTPYGNIELECRNENGKTLVNVKSPAECKRKV